MANRAPLLPEPDLVRKGPDAAGDPLEGTPYKAVGPLGRGGMGEVLEAEHMGLQKRVVVKLLHPELVRDPKLVDRLQVEARALAVLASPHIVSVTDFGWTREGRPYLVMPRLHGRTLREELRARGALPVVEALRWVQQILVGLDAAHRRGIIHRDVKLDNVFLCDASETEPRHVKLLDFGVAKIVHVAGSAPAPAPHLPTQEGMLIGTPRFVAPEQVRCAAVDARTDVYAVGLVLFMLIVGHGPFPGARDALDLLNAHLTEAPPAPSLHAPQRILPELDCAVLKALAKRPEDRFQSAREFASELAAIAELAAAITEPLGVPALVAADDTSERRTLVMAPSRRERRPETEATTRGGRARARELPEARRTSVSAFLAVMAASAIVFSGLIAAAIHYLAKG